MYAIYNRSRNERAHLRFFPPSVDSRKKNLFPPRGKGKVHSASRDKRIFPPYTDEPT